MASVDWSIICGTAYFTRDLRLTLFDVETNGSKRSVGTQRLSFVLHLTDRHADKELAPILIVRSPHGDVWLADSVRDFCVDTHADYFVLHMPAIVLNEEGLYRFELMLGAGGPMTFEVHVQESARKVVKVCAHGAY